MKSIEVSAKKVEDAIADGLRTLGTTIDDVTVEILSQGGLFKKARVRLTLSTEDEPAEEFGRPAQSAKPAAEERKTESKAEKPEEKGREERKPAKPEKKREERAAGGQTDAAGEAKSDSIRDKSDRPWRDKNRPPRRETERVPMPVPEETAAEALSFLTDVLRLMNIECALKPDNTDGLNVELVTDDSAVIGYRGETLDALQYLTRLAVTKGDEKFVRVRLDCNNYREKRQGTLASLAGKMADKCVRTGRRVALEPMDSADRRVIHAALGDDSRVVTRSEGHEPNRHVVILPRREKR